MRSFLIAHMAVRYSLSHYLLLIGWLALTLFKQLDGLWYTRQSSKQSSKFSNPAQLTAYGGLAKARLDNDFF